MQPLPGESGVLAYQKPNWFDFGRLFARRVLMTFLPLRHFYTFRRIISKNGGEVELFR